MGAELWARLIPLIMGSSARPGLFAKQSPGHSHEPERRKLGKAKPWQPLQDWSSSWLRPEPFHAWSCREGATRNGGFVLLPTELGCFCWDVHSSSLQSPFYPDRAPPSRGQQLHDPFLALKPFPVPAGVATPHTSILFLLHAQVFPFLFPLRCHQKDTKSLCAFSLSLAGRPFLMDTHQNHSQKSRS